MASMDSFDLCTSHKDYYLLAAAVRSFFLVIATHLLAGEVDTSTLSEEAAILPRLMWLLRYFNPLNLSWRYYSIFAYRIVAGRAWGEKQLAIINYEAHPCRAPVPFIVTEAVNPYHVRRLEPSGFFSSQGLLTISAGYQGILAVQYTISTAGVAFLPNITMPLAIIGLFRVLVYPWITNKVYVDPYPYPCSQAIQMGDMHINPYKPSRVVAASWFLVLSFLVFLSLWPLFAYPAFDLPKEILQFTIQMFYIYLTVSELVFHAALLWQGAGAWANRIVFFDHWVYKVQTAGFMGLLACTFVLGVADFLEHDYYRECI
ncbi:hypothetical protein GOP47_0011890 [Adiantum capillus-veneris]|uniref:Uncharacterized protein n=1 Tax=Adiantum capillus-veneris TaxID=13818 RepID=A0A9D4UU27_ADICA|nr:hypothetical protein GOP47_0011890 [Adiantum capillus-veneris]